MNIFKDIPGMKEDLELVEATAREISRDTLQRQPLSEVIDAVFASPGKMLRPALVLLFGSLGPGYPACKDRLIKAAAIVEMTHLASLAHDDIVDDAPFRRGRPTLQSAYGKDMAVYAGDFLLSRVLSSLMTQDMLAVGQSLSRGLADMCSGELSQYTAQFNTNTDENRYFMNISGKTAALFSASCEIGAIVSDCERYTVSAASNFGHSLGVIFQLRDDLIDCLPDSIESGKKKGMDFTNGIYTLPVIYSFSDRKHGPKLKALAADAAKMEPAAVFEQLFELITAAGGIDYTKWIMGQYKERALNSLNNLPTSPVQTQLSSLLDALQDC